MADIQSISSGLKLGENGIWHSTDTETISYPSDGNDRCFSVEEGSFWFRHRNKCIVSIVNAYPPKNNEAIFDIGAGNGFVSLGLADAGFDVVSVDPGITGSLQAKKRGLRNVVCATSHTAKFKQRSLTAVGLFDVIEHIDDDLAFLKSIKDLIRKDGYLYATVPAYSFLWSQEDICAGHFRRYTLKGVCDILRSAGFQIEFSSYFFRFIPFPVFIFRTLPYLLGLSGGNEKHSDYFPESCSERHSKKNNP